MIFFDENIYENFNSFIKEIEHTPNLLIIASWCLNVCFLYTNYVVPNKGILIINGNFCVIFTFG